jgi:hypothetical protein
MGGNLTRAIKCFFKCPSCTFSVIVSPAALADHRVVYTLQERCPEVDLERLGFYAGLFLALLFVLFCAVAYFFFNVLRLISCTRKCPYTTYPRYKTGVVEINDLRGRRIEQGEQCTGAVGR